MIGKLSKYETKNMTFTNAVNDNSYVVIPVSFAPKIVLFTGGSDTEGNIMCGIFMFDPDNTDNKRSGGVSAINASNHTLSGGSYYPLYIDSAPSAMATRCYYYDGNVYISRVNSNMYWSNSDTYTFEIYG